MIVELFIFEGMKKEAKKTFTGTVKHPAHAYIFCPTPGTTAAILVLTGWRKENSYRLVIQPMTITQFILHENEPDS